MRKFLFITFLIFYRFTGLCQTAKDTSQNYKEKILEIIYDESAGEGGQTIFSVTRDSVFYSSSTFIGSGIHLEKKEKNNDKEWFDLTKSISLKEFDSIKSDKSDRDVDGGDTQITIQTSKSKYLLIIGSSTKNYAPIKKFLHNLLIEMKRFDKNINTEYYHDILNYMNHYK